MTAFVTGSVPELWIRDSEMEQHRFRRATRQIRNDGSRAASSIFVLVPILCPLLSTRRLRSRRRTPQNSSTPAPQERRAQPRRSGTLSSWLTVGTDEKLVQTSTSG